LKTGEIRHKPKHEIVEEIDATKRELMNISFQWQVSESGNTMQKRNIRKDIARLKTILREKELGINNHLNTEDQT